MDNFLLINNIVPNMEGFINTKATVDVFITANKKKEFN